jgi:hypothetical protein
MNPVCKFKYILKNISMKQVAFPRILLTFSFLILACRKSDSQMSDSISINTVTQTSDSLTNNNVFKIGDWKAYPYFTDSPDEDSFFSSWSPELTNEVYSTYKRVFIKMKDGNIVPVSEFINVGPNDSGFLYQPGKNLGANNKILLWWIQKVDGTRPDADSCILR